MAKIKPISIVAEISGKLDKSELLTFYTLKSGKIFAHLNRAAGDQEPSAAQLAVQQKFTDVIALVEIDMQDESVKVQWEAAAKNSKGKFASARGAAFSHHWDNFEEA